jgi:hypothetical protein
MSVTGAEVTSARVMTLDGRLAATVDRVDVGGGSQIVTVDGTPEERIHPTSTVWHVRLLAPNRMLPDELREEPSWEAATKVAEAYAAKLDENASRIAELAENLRV